MAAPSHWMLNKLGGTYSSRPSTGPHKRFECIPISVLLRNRLRYAMSRQEAIKIVKDKEGLIKVDGKIRRDDRFPLGMMDVVSIERTGEHFRILYDVKGRFQAHKIDDKEAKFKLCRVQKKAMGPNKVPFIVTHDGRTIRYPHPEVKKLDTVKVRSFFPILKYLLFNNHKTHLSIIVEPRDKRSRSFDQVRERCPSSHHWR